MKTGSAREGYSALQIALHWIVVMLVLFQLVFGEDMAHFFRAVERGQTPQPDQALWGNLHIWVGFGVLAAVFLRVLLRRQSAPPPAEDNRFLVLAARVTHFAFYATLIAMPVTGVLAYYFEISAMGEIHEIGKPVLIALIVVHALAALWHQFVRRDGGLMRMVVPR